MGKGIVVCVVAGVIACAKADKTAQPERPHHDSVSVIDTAKPSAPPAASAVDSTSPRLVVDGAAREPALEFHDGEFVVRLPVEMARVLEDSLPGFAPLKRSVFDKDVTNWMDHYEDHVPPSLDPADSSALWATALSVAVGDFDGDSKRDIAMEGISGDGYSVFLLLSASGVNARPALMFLFGHGTNDAQYYKQSVSEFLTLVPPGKQKGFAEEGDPPILDLRHDAVEHTNFGKASSIYYVEKGVIKQFTTSD